VTAIIAAPPRNAYFRQVFGRLSRDVAFVAGLIAQCVAVVVAELSLWIGISRACSWKRRLILPLVILAARRCDAQRRMPEAMMRAPGFGIATAFVCHVRLQGVLARIAKRCALANYGRRLESIKVEQLDLMEWRSRTLLVPNQFAVKGARFSTRCSL